MYLARSVQDLKSYTNKYREAIWLMLSGIEPSDWTFHQFGHVIMALLSSRIVKSSDVSITWNELNRVINITFHAIWQYNSSWSSSVGTSTAYGLDDRRIGFYSRQREKIFLFYTASRSTLESIQPPIQRVQGIFSFPFSISHLYLLHSFLFQNS
jgi:hypothetical protein